VLVLLCQILIPSSKISQFKPMLKFISLQTKIIYKVFYGGGGGEGGLEGSRNDVSFRVYQAKGDEKRQGEGGGT
jgi:hypothetical protein